MYRFSLPLSRNLIRKIRSEQIIIPTRLTLQLNIIHENRIFHINYYVCNKIISTLIYLTKASSIILILWVDSHISLYLLRIVK